MLSLEERCHSNAERELNRLARGPRRGDDNHPPAWMTSTTIRLPIGRQEVIAGWMHREKERALSERREGENGDPRERGDRRPTSIPSGAHGARYASGLLTGEISRRTRTGHPGNDCHDTDRRGGRRRGDRAGHGAPKRPPGGVSDLAVSCGGSHADRRSARRVNRR